MKKIILSIMMVLSFISLTLNAQEKASNNLKPRKHEGYTIKYVCPNHPEITSDKPGTCSICGTALNLSPKEKVKWASAKLYSCSMHPDVRSDKPGKCPKCGMEMIEMKQVYCCPDHPNMVSEKPGTCPECNKPLNLSVKEKAKWESMKLFTCPMHPDVKSTAAGKCPKCGMDMTEAKTKSKSKGVKG
jgi:uncharacterized paraquat-inducible protein A